MTLQNNTLVLDSSSTTTGSDGMNLVLRQGVLHHGDSYIFTLHVTDDSLDGEGAASITLEYNMPPAGGKCHLTGGGETGVEYGDREGEVWRIKTLLDRVQFNCSGRQNEGVTHNILALISFHLLSSLQISCTITHHLFTKIVVFASLVCSFLCCSLSSLQVTVI